MSDNYKLCHCHVTAIYPNCVAVRKLGTNETVVLDNNKIKINQYFIEGRICTMQVLESYGIEKGLVLCDK